MQQIFMCWDVPHHIVEKQKQNCKKCFPKVECCFAGSKWNETAFRAFLFTGSWHPCWEKRRWTCNLASSCCYRSVDAPVIFFKVWVTVPLQFANQWMPNWQLRELPQSSPHPKCPGISNDAGVLVMVWRTDDFDKKPRILWRLQKNSERWWKKLIPHSRKSFI